ncbi:hypothetical protein LMA_01664 [Liquorilactobacillus mali KCTC 3596 = DSM 20444]|uniref:Uncharacterized protein n=1 Tax=Liquorilactobacillus mali KCTC 3596 = DSM 20444 TaxID=1046596 RepID=J1F559_9LACO|nr:hypothetical protein LMA_01664 [Liquorilactobacillus mali KCTC 3596 = DSM 20444]KRN08601.1 hypothetical protein FD00_GL002159 [Liquorilactobacillus mali KCTC 3596 = DSM 20444]
MLLARLVLKTIRVLTATAANITVPVHNLKKVEKILKEIDNIDIKYIFFFHSFFANLFLETKKDI